MAAELEQSEKLRIWDRSGLKIDVDGHISDWQDLPPKEAKPIEYNSSGGLMQRDRISRKHFTAQDDDILQEWCLTAEAEGISGSQAFEELEAIRPVHTWQAYQNRWRKTLKPALVLVLDCPIRHQSTHETLFLGLSTTTDGQTERLRCLEDPNDEEDEEDDGNDGNAVAADTNFLSARRQSAQESYTSQRVDIDHILFRNIGLSDENQFRRLLSQLWFLKLFEETCLEYAGDVSSIRATYSADQSLLGASHHRWKLERVAFLLARPEVASRYTAQAPDTSTWTVDDLDVRFLVRAVSDGSSRGAIWERDKNELGYLPIYERALWLLLWVKWLFRQTMGIGREMQRQQSKRERWLVFLRQKVEGTHQSINAPVGRGLSSIAQREDLHRQLFLISDSARELYLRKRDSRLTDWGVTAKYLGTCVLVPAAWASTRPEDLIDNVDDWLHVEFRVPRLAISLGAFHFSWARAAAWFEDWPRDAIDLQAFLPPTSARVEHSNLHGSHLCHHGLCIVPAHLVYEDSVKNNERKTCADAAQALRAYGIPVPQYCNAHEPCCLLQAAALTTYEVLGMQFDILRVARDLPAQPPRIRPIHHPVRFTTFEQGMTGSTKFEHIGVNPEGIVRLGTQTVQDFPQRFTWPCSFCSYPRRFTRITTFWAHVRDNHPQEEREDVLTQVCRSGTAYQAWSDNQGYELKHSNPITWQKIMQTQAPDFTWDVFISWRLSTNRSLLGHNESEKGNE